MKDKKRIVLMVILLLIGLFILYLLLRGKNTSTKEIVTNERVISIPSVQTIFNNVAVSGNKDHCNSCNSDLAEVQNVNYDTLNIAQNEIIKNLGAIIANVNANRGGWYGIN